jgi:hypothetical protein
MYMGTIMSLEIGWKKLLEDNLRQFDPDPRHGLDDLLYVDLNGNGVAEPNEAVDDMTRDADHGPYYVDEAEAKEFCIKNWNLLAEKIPFLRYARQFMISPDNPINSLILYESQLLAPYRDVESLIEKAYTDIAMIRNYAIGYSITWGMDSTRDPTPVEQMLWVRQGMIERGILFELGGSLLFIEKFSTPKKIFNCVSTFILIAVAYDLGWPVHGVLAPNHIFGRWDDDEAGNFEVQNGRHYDNDFYIHYDPNGPVGRSRRNFERIAGVSIDSGVYLRTLDERELEAIFYFNIGQALATLPDFFGERLDDAAAAYTESIARYPQNAFAYAGRGLAELEEGESDAAFADLTTAAELDPNLPNAHEGLGAIYSLREDYESAVAELDLALSLNETAGAYVNRGVAESHLALATDDTHLRQRLIAKAIISQIRSILR